MRFIVFLLSLALIAVSSVVSAAERLDTIQSKKTLRVGTPGDYRPFAMLHDGQYEGFDIDVIQMIAKELNVSVSFVPTTWRTLLDDMHANKFDVAVGGITRTTARMSRYPFLPGYASFGKVALIRLADKSKYTTLESMNQPGVRVIKNPGGTNEAFVLANLSKAKISTHEKNAEIPALIAEGKGDVMITETYEALLYAQKDNRLYAAFVDHPLTPINQLGFWLQKDDPDFVRVMNYAWELLQLRGDLQKVEAKYGVK